jgi:hypothetical protein
MPDKCRFFDRRFKFYFRIFFFLGMFASGCTPSNDPIRQAVQNQLKLYPASTLQDIYKSFFQDEFGPGHMAPDSAGAAQYLEYELAEMTSRGNFSPEPCGTGRNFYRVPLDLVKDSLISSSELLDAFLASSAGFKEPDIEAWKVKWAGILEVIDAMNLNLPGCESDKEALTKMLASGEAVVHHSPAFIQAYNPHYRIISVSELNQFNSKFKTQNSKF